MACWIFFFQAEDGIRVFHVTGVQTCALPISSVAPGVIDTDMQEHIRGSDRRQFPDLDRFLQLHRSEERRVGKECKDRRAVCQDSRSMRAVGEGEGNSGDTARRAAVMRTAAST